MDVVRELLIRLGVIADTKQIEKFDSGLKAVATRMAGLTGIATAVQGAITGVVMATAAAGDKALKTSQKIGVEVEALQELQHAAGMSGVASDELAVALKFLNVNIDKAASGGKEQTATFAKMGVSFKNADGTIRGADAVLTDLASSFKAMSDGPQKTAKAVEIFGRAGASMIPMLNSGTAGIKQMREEARELGIVMNRQATKDSEDFNDELERLHKSVMGVGVLVASKLLKPLQNLAERFRRLVVANREMLAQRIERTFTMIGDGIVWMSDKIEMAYGVVTKFTDALGGLENTLKIVGVVFMASIGVQAVAAVAAFSKALMGLTLASATPALIVAAVAGVLLILEDLYTFIQGGESEFGEFWGPFVTGTNEVYDAFERLGDISLTDIIKGQWDNFKAYIVDGLDSLAETIESWGSGIATAIRDKVLSFVQPVMDTVTKLGNVFGAKLGGVATGLNNALGTGGGAGAAGVVSAVTNNRTSTTGATVNNQPTINVTVNGGAGAPGASGQANALAQDIAGAVAKAQAASMRQAALNVTP